MPEAEAATTKMGDGHDGIVATGDNGSDAPSLQQVLVVSDAGQTEEAELHFVYADDPTVRPYRLNPWRSGWYLAFLSTGSGLSADKRRVFFFFFFFFSFSDVVWSSAIPQNT